MLAPALGRHGGHRALHDLQERLLHALARDVPGDRGVVGLARDLVDLVNIDDAALGPLDIVFRRLEQLEDDVLDILAHIAGFGQRRRVGHGERHVEDPSQRLRQQRLAAASGADQHDVRLGQFDIRLTRMVEALVVIMDGHREDALGVLLTDHVIVQHLADLARGRRSVGGLEAGGLRLLADDVHAEFDAFVADEHRGPGDQLAHLVLGLSAEAAIERVFAVAGAGIVGHAALLGGHIAIRPTTGPIAPASYVCCCRQT